MKKRAEINWLRMEARIHEVIRRVNDLDRSVRYDPMVAAPYLATALTEIDEIIAAETGRGACLDLGALVSTEVHEAIQRSAWNEA